MAEKEKSWWELLGMTITQSFFVTIIVNVTLKNAGLVDWSWWYVCWPILVPLALAVVVVVLLIIMKAVKWAIKTDDDQILTTTKTNHD